MFALEDYDVVEDGMLGRRVQHVSTVAQRKWSSRGVQAAMRGTKESQEAFPAPPNDIYPRIWWRQGYTAQKTMVYLPYVPPPPPKPPGQKPGWFIQRPGGPLPPAPPKGYRWERVQETRAGTSYRLSPIRRKPLTSFPKYGRLPLSHGLDGLGATWSEDAFARADRAQRALAVLNTEVNAIGKEAWDTVAAETKKAHPAALTPPYFLAFDLVADKTGGFLRGEAFPSIVVTASYFPSDQALYMAEVATGEIRKMVDYVKKILPEIRAGVEAAAARTAAAVGRTPLESPQAAGDAAFVRSVEARAKALGLGIGTGLLTMAAIGIGAMVLLTQLGRK